MKLHYLRRFQHFLKSNLLLFHYRFSAVIVLISGTEFRDMVIDLHRERKRVGLNLNKSKTGGVHWQNT